MSLNDNSHWDEKFKKREWGRYPPEDLVRFFGRRFRSSVYKGNINVLEVGCGTGANVWFLHREGFSVSGIDCAPTGVTRALTRTETENQYANSLPADLRVGDFRELPWDDDTFDVVFDVFAIYANPIDTITLAVHEIKRVLKPGGVFYSKIWGKKTTGFGEGVLIERDTYTEIPRGPMLNMGLCTFFDRKSAAECFGTIGKLTIDEINRTDNENVIQELLVTCET